MKKILLIIKRCYDNFHEKNNKESYVIKNFNKKLNRVNSTNRRRILESYNSDSKLRFDYKDFMLDGFVSRNYTQRPDSKYVWLNVHAYDKIAVLTTYNSDKNKFAITWENVDDTKKEPYIIKNKNIITDTDGLPLTTQNFSTCYNVGHKLTYNFDAEYYISDNEYSITHNFVLSSIIENSSTKYDKLKYVIMTEHNFYTVDKTYKKVKGMVDYYISKLGTFDVYTKDVLIGGSNIREFLFVLKKPIFETTNDFYGRYRATISQKTFTIDLYKIFSDAMCNDLNYFVPHKIDSVEMKIDRKNTYGTFVLNKMDINEVDKGSNKIVIRHINLIKSKNA